MGVGDDQTLEAPLVAEQVGEQGGVAARPLGADVVEGGHDAQGAALLDGHLKGLQVDLPHGLLVAPGEELVAVVGLALVEGKVLDEADDALVGGAADHVGGDGTGQEAVLGVVLEVTAVEGGAVGVHGGGIPAGVAVDLGLAAGAGAHHVGDVLIPGGGDDHGAGVGDAGGVGAHDGAGVGGGAHADGAIGGAGEGHAQTLQALNVPGAVAGEQGHLVQGQLGDELVPLGVVLGHALHVGEHDGGVQSHAHSGHVGLGQAQLSVGGGGVAGNGVQNGLGSGEVLLLGAGEGAAVLVPLTGQEVVGTHGVVKQVGDGHQIAGALAVVGVVVDDVVGQGPGLLVHHVVGVAAQGDDVVAGLQGPGLVGGVVVGGHVLHVELDGVVLGGAGLNQVGLLEGHQIHGGLLNGAGVGRIVVDLQHVLAGHVAGVGDLHPDSDHAVFLVDGHDILVKGGVGQAGAEGEHDLAVVVIALVGVVAGLKVLVAHVDALAVLSKVAGVVGGVGVVVAVGVPGAVGLQLEVVVGGGGGQVIHKPGVSQAAGGVHLAAEDAHQGVDAGLTGVTNPQDALDLGIIPQEIQLHGVGGVEHQDDLVELGAHGVHHGGLVLGELEQGGREVKDLAAAPADEDHGHVGVVVGVVQDGAAVVIEGGVGEDAAGHIGDGDVAGLGDELGSAAVAGSLGGSDGGLAGLVVVVVEVEQVGVELVVALGHGVLQADALVNHGGGGAAGVVHQLHGTHAEHVDLGLVLGRGGQRHQVLVVLHEDKALVGDGLGGVAGGGVGHLLLGGVRLELGQEPVAGIGDDKGVDQNGHQQHHHGNGHADADFSALAQGLLCFRLLHFHFSFLFSAMCPYTLQKKNTDRGEK
ncbi:Uncharacterised protein [uncultured Flavonifractor sp.]|nr:Uncharacterised protein [uncultured Flavonifractor sp.]